MNFKNLVTRTLMLLLLGVITLGCRSRNDSQLKTYLKEEVRGSIDGKEWVYKYAYLDPTVDTAIEDDYVFVFLDYKPKKPCPKSEAIPEKVRTLLVSSSGEKGKKSEKLKRGTQRTAVFQWLENGKPFAKVARYGKIRIYKKKNNKVYGKILARYNDDTWVNGKFIADHCEFRDMTDEFDEEMWTED